MKKISILLIILFISCEAPSSGVSQNDSDIFEKNVATLKNDFIKGYEEGDYDKVVSIFADSIQWYGPGVNSEMLKGIDILKENVAFWMENFENITISNFNISAASKNKADIKLTNGEKFKFLNDRSPNQRTKIIYPKTQ